jgi:hypothetical protein
MLWCLSRRGDMGRKLAGASATDARRNLPALWSDCVSTQRYLKSHTYPQLTLSLCFPCFS